MMMRQAAVLLSAVLAATGSVAQTAIPETAAAPLLDAVARGCTLYGLGKQQFVPGDDGKPAPMNEWSRGMLALEKLGVVSIAATGERQPRTATFNVVLNVKPDGKRMRLENDGVCIAGYDYEEARVEFTKVDYVKGGQTGWLGAIAYSVIRGRKLSPLVRDLQSLSGDHVLPNDAPDPQYRVLFREDPSDRNWRFITFDSYVTHDLYFTQTQTFATDNVVQALKRD
jgi:hypothetical protein